MMAHTHRILDSGQELIDSGIDHPGKQYLTESETRTNLNRWYEACQLQNGITNAELRKTLDKLAQQGHVMARYLYASWRPDFINEPDAFFLQYEWESKARQYSFSNLEEGELGGTACFRTILSGSALYTWRLQSWHGILHGSF